MKLEFEQTVEHIRDLQKNHFLKNKWIKRFGIFMIIMFAFNLMGTFFMEEFKIENLISSIIPILTIGVLWWFLI
ncbi:MAG: hypothetical protein AB8F94_29260 [Saprospiraceae bacterium]